MIEVKTVLSAMIALGLSLLKSPAEPGFPLRSRGFGSSIF
jgi:hypothetical protein